VVWLSPGRRMADFVRSSFFLPPGLPVHPGVVLLSRTGITLWFCLIDHFLPPNFLRTPLFQDLFIRLPFYSALFDPRYPEELLRCQFGNLRRLCPTSSQNPRALPLANYLFLFLSLAPPLELGQRRNSPEWPERPVLPPVRSASFYRLPLFFYL